MMTRTASRNELVRKPADAAQAASVNMTSLTGVQDAARHCRACPLWENATQTVFGEGPDDARLIFVGEQPGDAEDIAGLPFVGPAGRIFNRALAEAGIERKEVYVTNAVKHFKFEQRGKRRLHKRPDAGEIEICRWWLSRELEIIEPSLVVALGATAARSLSGKPMPIERSRGELLPFGSNGGRMLVTVHPSYLLRLREENDRAREFGRFVDDLRIAAAA
ncbi:MAG: UdgX family uracil-DNA binding protein [Hyphomicrobiales bacterium]|nr:UdgX family uracil-DNA binding protein [Hyphomicrobiales bacterium]MBV9114239.1 UdgX family uracil-DNA binding protein [Hyphomicrobiales bacterium]MBV9519409.1 UdgX family uracil-DNA binding protein [Hyphomicrobiales bacterium]